MVQKKSTMGCIIHHCHLTIFPKNIKTTSHLLHSSSHLQFSLLKILGDLIPHLKEWREEQGRGGNYFFKKARKYKVAVGIPPMRPKYVHVVYVENILLSILFNCLFFFLFTFTLSQKFVIFIF